jgi:phosphohistidine phosphatase SixA
MSRFGSLIAALFIVAALPASAQPRGLLSQLQRGGFVLVMRHAHAPRETPSAPDPANRAHERQLDPQGKSAARTMGVALRRLHIPIGQVLSSPTYRARETARLAGFPAPTIAAELGDGGHSMQRLGAPQGDWLRQRANQPPPRGSNTLIVTHMPNIVAAFPQDATGLEDGETLVFRPDRRGARLVARVKIDAWARMH